MDDKTVKIIFHSLEHFTIEASKLEDLVCIESESRYTFIMPINNNQPAGLSIQETLQACSILLTRPAVPLVNGRPEDFRYILQPGDEVVMLVQIAGG